MLEYKVDQRDTRVLRLRLDGPLPAWKFGRGLGAIGIQIDKEHAVKVDYMMPSPVLGVTRQVARAVSLETSGKLGGIFTERIASRIAIGIGYLGPHGRWQYASLAQLDGGNPRSLMNWDVMFGDMPDPTCRYAAIYTSESSIALDSITSLLQTQVANVIQYVAGPGASGTFGIMQGGWFGELI